MHTFKFYAEAPCDVGHVLSDVLVWKMSYKWNGPGFGCLVTFTSDWDRAKVVAAMGKIMDGHAMVRSLEQIK